jgi:hypothetical protein
MKMSSKFITRTSLVVLQVVLGASVCNASSNRAFTEEFGDRESVDARRVQPPVHPSPSGSSSAFSNFYSLDAQELFNLSTHFQYRTILVGINYSPDDPDNLAAIRKCADLKTKVDEDHIAAAKAFLTIGIPPTKDYIECYANYNAEDAEAFLTAVKIGFEDPTDEHIEGVAAFLEEDLDPTREQIERWLLLDKDKAEAFVTAVAIGIKDPTGHHIAGVGAFLEKDINPTQAQITRWLLLSEDRAKAFIVTLTAGIEDPTDDEIEATKDYIKHGVPKPTTEQIEDWLNDPDAETREMRAVAVHAGIQTPTIEQLGATLALREAAHGLLYPSAKAINGWLDSPETRAARERIAAFLGEDPSDETRIADEMLHDSIDWFPY